MRRLRRPCLGQRRGNAYLDRVVATVKATLEFGDLRASAEAPGQAEGVERRFRAGVAETQPLHRRHTPADLLGQIRLEADRRAEHHAPLELVLFLSIVFR